VSFLTATMAEVDKFHGGLETVTTVRLFVTHCLYMCLHVHVCICVYVLKGV